MTPDATPRGLGRDLPALDAAVRRGLDRSGATVRDVVVLPPLPRAYSALRYEVVGPEGGEHTLRVEPSSETRTAYLVSSLTGGRDRQPTSVLRVEDEVAGVGDTERERLLTDPSAPSTLYASNELVLAAAEALADYRVTDLEALVSSATTGRETVVPVVLSMVRDVTSSRAETGATYLETVLSLLADLDAGAPLEWALRRAGEVRERRRATPRRVRLPRGEAVVR